MLELPVVAIVGAGPSGLATAVSLQQLSIPSIIFEKENCCASLWKNRSYDRLKLHLAKEFCSLPYFRFPTSTPKYIPKQTFIKYMDAYVAKFKLKPLYCRFVQSATFNTSLKKWAVEVKNTTTNKIDVYNAQFLIIASGENSEGFIPDLHGLDSFPGEIIHSSHYKSGDHFHGKRALVVGCGNSGMEIAYDLNNNGVDSSIVVKNPVHILNEELVYVGMKLLKFFPFGLVDRLVMFLARIKYGDLSKYGLRRPEKGPFILKARTGRSPVIDVGTIDKIKKGEIKVFPGLAKIQGNHVTFENGEEKDFDTMVFATGYRSTANEWLKDFYYVLNEEGMPKAKFPNHWKGENGLYCAGFSSRGLVGISMDADAIADDIFNNYMVENVKEL
ncbi:hypothetical protein AQUCO_02200279v1 [Aquilegia coerulea]|uniref:Flavin-containing monooxygenase n=1 Tax=Aquilegia coerulea TaxID=218851 RepID=A0A2G5DDY1_AQUCA|nr:hypothetical protein AQUCO_02200279v1 [Aquilegia coerulea]